MSVPVNEQETTISFMRNSDKAIIEDEEDAEADGEDEEDTEVDGETAEDSEEDGENVEDTEERERPDDFVAKESSDAGESDEKKRIDKMVWFHILR